MAARQVYKAKLPVLPLMALGFAFLPVRPSSDNEIMLSCADQYL